MKATNEKPIDPQELSRIAAAIHLDALKEMRPKAADAAQAMSRWVIASLLLINGGASVATLPQLTGEIWSLASGAFFIAGVMLALGAGEQNMFMVNRAYTSFAPLVGYWSGVAIDGKRIQDQEERIRGESEIIATAENLIYSISRFSALCFFLGCLTFAIHVIAPAATRLAEAPSAAPASPGTERIEADREGPPNLPSRRASPTQNRSESATNRTKGNQS